MVEGHDFTSSQSIAKSSVDNVSNIANKVNLPSKSQLLRNDNGELTWYGNLEELKHFICEHLKLSGKWSSPGGETKLFTNDEITLKWNGPNRKKISVVKDDISHLEDILQKCSAIACSSQTQTVKTNNHANIEHVREEEGRLRGETCKKWLENENEIKKMKEEITKMNSLINKVIENQQAINTNCNDKVNETEDVQTLLNTINKMADELEPLKVEVEQIAKDNTQMKVILDIKQNEWITVHERKHAGHSQETSAVVENVIPTTNRFDVLEDTAQTQSNEESVDESTVLGYVSFPSPHPMQKSDQPKHMKAKRGKARILVIGDSMVKNIKTAKLSRTAKTSLLRNTPWSENRQSERRI